MMKVFNIPSHEDFLEELINGIEEKIDKNQLSETLILLPSHRICQELDYKFVQRNFGVNFIPPKMASIGDIEQSLSFSIFDELASLPSAITNTSAKFLLSDLIVRSHKISNAEALNIADNLLKLISKFEKEDLNLNSINKIFLGDAPAHVEKTLDYLKLISNSWPQLLSDKKQTTQLSRRNIFLKKLIKHWGKSSPDHHIILAGSTGTFQSTRLLIKSIASLESGFVVLQGIENLEQKHLDETDKYFQLNSLIKSLDLNIQDVDYWSNKKEKTSTNKSLLENKELQYIECTSSQEESKVIGLKVRHLLHLGVDNIGIITNDEKIRTRTQANLKVWNINSESSDGIPFKSTEQCSLLILIFEVYLSNFSPLPLLKLLRHRFCLLDTEKAVSALEIKYLRGIKKYNNIESLMYVSSKKGDQNISILLQNLYNKILPLYEILKTKKASIRAIFSTIKNIAESISTAPELETPQIWSEESGAKAYDIVNSILNTLPATKIHAHEFQEIFNHAISEQNIYKSSQTRAKVRILSPIDSRLIKFDYIILAGLNEKSWPSSPEIDPWISSLFYKNIGIPDHRIKIGQSANDFFSLILQHDKILITRSNQNNGSPQIASRFLTEIEIRAKELGEKIITDPLEIKEWVRLINYPQTFIKYNAPSVKPPVTIRPSKLSVTQIEKLMRDPYSIYASKILKLKPLEPIDKKPNQLEFGNIVHDIIDTFNNSYAEIKEHQYYQKFIDIGEQKLKSLESNPIIHKLWIPRLNKMAEYLAKYESTSRKSHIIHSESTNEIALTKNFSLIAKIDRIERNISDNTAVVADFKTGSVPTQEDIKNGFSPQLTLGAFLVESINRNERVIEMIYIQLATSKKLGKITKVKGDSSKLIKAAQEGILKLVKKYSDPNTAYLICPDHDKRPTYNEFEHLERIDELI